MNEQQVNRRDVLGARWMALFFALGSLCFLIAPLSAYAKLVGGHADALTFFVGSILFTLGGGTQSWLAWPEHTVRGAGRAAWATAWIQSVGTIAFNVMTFLAIDISVTDSSYNRLVWRPNAFGSVCFLVSGMIAYHQLPRPGWIPQIHNPGWWEPVVNLLGCVLFGVSAVGGYVDSSTGAMLNLTVANWGTSLGALCFFLCAMPPLLIGRTFKVPRLQLLRELERTVERDVREVEHDLDQIL